MRDLSRSQLLVYAAIAVALLLIGVRWVRSGEHRESASFGPSAGGVADHGGTAGGLTLERSSGGLVVHVAGAVREPGVYRLPGGSRVADAVQRAGGATTGALADAINLAATLADGQQVVVPGRAEATATSATATGGIEGPISLGTATPEQLDTIEGIGPVTAAEIIEFRDQHGGVGSIDDLDQISGIGPVTMQALSDGLQP